MPKLDDILKLAAQYDTLPSLEYNENSAPLDKPTVVEVNSPLKPIVFYKNSQELARRLGKIAYLTHRASKLAASDPGDGSDLLEPMLGMDNFFSQIRDEMIQCGRIYDKLKLGKKI